MSDIAKSLNMPPTACVSAPVCVSPTCKSTLHHAVSTVARWWCSHDWGEACSVRNASLYSCFISLWMVHPCLQVVTFDSLCYSRTVTAISSVIPNCANAVSVLLHGAGQT